MLIFPDIQAPSFNGFTETHKNHARTMEVEDDTVLTRRIVTGKHRSWEVKWESLKTSDFMKLTDFYDNKVFQGALKFLWRYPVDKGNGDSGKQITVRFKSELKASPSGPGRWDVSATIEEA